MQAPRKRTALLASIAVGAVATMGLGFAAFTQTLNATAVVGTGDLDVRFANLVGDNCTPKSTTTGFEVTVKDVAPGFSCKITTDILNKGTVDAEVTEVESGDATGMTLTADGIEAGEVLAKGVGKVSPTFTLAVNDNAAQGAKETLTATIGFANATPKKS